MKFPLLGFILLLTFARTGFAQDFVHPGSWITQAGCDRISSNVAAGKEPWASAWKALKNSDAQADYKPNSNTAVTNSYAMQNDGHAAWVLSVKWIASGDKSYADAAIRILNAWSSKTAVPDDTLRTGLGATQMINAAELIRCANNGAAGWDPADATKFEEFCKNLLYPVVKKNGGGGWGTPCLSALVAMGVFCNDHAIYELGKSMYMENRRETDPGCDKSCLREYIFDNGQNGDTYRDQGHSMGALAHLAECAETCANQGDSSLWTAYDNLLLKGYEYVAKYNLGNDVDFVPYVDGNGKHKDSIGATGRVSAGGSWSPMFEIAYNRFKILGLSSPYTKQVRDSYAPESTNGDNCGMGTLIFTIDPPTPTPSPSL
jgi:hypothetical protein